MIDGSLVIPEGGVGNPLSIYRAGRAQVIGVIMRQLGNDSAVLVHDKQLGGVVGAG